MTAGETSAQAWSRLRAALLATLEPLVPPDAPVVLVGSGLRNVGDCAIAAATRAWLARRGHARWLEVDRRTYHRRAMTRALGDDGTLLLAGGGTIGDVWRSQEALRRRALADFPAHRTVQLPQTIHFKDPEAARAAGDVYRASRRLTLLARDAESLATARDRWGLAAALAPDMSVVLDVRPRSPATRDVLWLLRDDKERPRGGPDGDVESPTAPDAVDWPEPASPRWRAVRRVVASTLAVPGGAARWRRAAIARWDDGETRARVAEGLALLATARVVVTNRLHGGLLSMLLGIPVVVVPERYGKTGGFHRAWLEGCRDVAWCETPEAVQSQVARWLGADAGRAGARTGRAAAE